MHSIFTRTLAIFLILIIILINSVIWLVWQLDLNDYRTTLSSIIAMQTGWRLEFSGPIEHHFVTKGLWLLIKDLQLSDPRGQFVDIEWLQANIALDKLLQRYIFIENLELAIRSCDIELRPEVPPPLPIILNVNAKSLSLTAKDCHVYDVVDKFETFIKDIALSVAPMPIVLDGWVVAGMPSGAINSKQSGTIQANSIAFEDVLGLNKLQLNFINDHGHISIPNLTTQLKPPNPLIPGLDSPQLNLTTQIHLNFNESHQELFRTLWNGVDDVWLDPLQITAQDLNLEMPMGSIHSENITIAGTSLPLLVARAAPITWLANSKLPNSPPSIMTAKPHTINIKGAKLEYAAANLTDYLFNITMQPGQFQATLDRGNLSLNFPTTPQPTTNAAEEATTEETNTNNVTANITGKVNLALDGLQPNGKLNQLLLEELQLNTQQLVLNLPNNSYSLDSGEAKIQAVPLIHNGKPLSVNIPEMFLNFTPNTSTANLQLQNLSHKESVMESLILKLAADNNSVALQRLEMNVAGTQMTGTGVWQFNAANTQQNMPWSFQLASDGIAIEPLLNLFNVPLPIQGNVNVDLKLNSSNWPLNNLLSNLNGTFKMAGQDLKILTTDIDSILAYLESSRGVGLLDLGAYIVLGPAGILLTKGTQYSVLLGSVIASGTSQITNMNTALRIEAGVVRTEDVALATAKHRLAVAGTLDLRAGGIANLQIATIDAKGCAKYMETIGGSGRNPQVSGTGVVINSVLNPVNSVVGTLLGPVIGGCFIPFYIGKVAPSPP